MTVRSGWTKRRSVAFLSGVAALACVSQAAFAQDASDDSEIVVTGYAAAKTGTGSKMDIPILETPQSVSVITREQLELLNFANLGDAIQYSSGIRGGIVGPDDRYDVTRVRGFRPAQYLDGMRLPRGAYALSRLDLVLAESIDVLKGPSSGLYGQVPPGGLINLVARKPEHNFSGRIDGQIGNFDNYRATADVTGSADANGDVRYRFTGLWYDRGSQVDYGGEKRLLAAPSLGLGNEDSLNITVFGLFQRDRNGNSLQFLPVDGTLEPNPNGQIPINAFAGEPGYNYFDRDEYYVGYLADYKVSDAVKIHQGLRYGVVDVNYRAVTSIALLKSLTGGTDAASYSTLLRQPYIVNERAEAFTVDTNVQAAFSTGPIEHKFMVGVDYGEFNTKFEDFYSFNGAPPINIYNPVYGQPFAAPPLTTRNLGKQRQTGIYAQEQAKLGGFVVTAGGRYDWVDTSQENLLSGITRTSDQSAFSGRVGLNYVFDMGVAPYIAYSKSFEPSQLGVDYLGNPFDPVTGTQWEAGVKYQPRTFNGMFTAAVFELTQTNLIVQNSALSNRLEQIGEARIRGAEIEAVARIGEGLSINGAVTYLDSEITKSSTTAHVGRWLPETPRWQASALFDYRFTQGALEGFGFSAGVRHTGRTYGDQFNEFGAPSFTLFDGILRYETGGWNFIVNVNNITNKTYIPNCYRVAATIGQCYYGKKRTALLTVGYSW